MGTCSNTDMADMQVTLHLKGKNLPKTDLGGLGKPDPYFTVSFAENEYYKSEVIKSTRKPDWGPVQFTLPDAAINQKVTITVMDKDKVTKDDLLQKFEIVYPFVKKTVCVHEGRNQGESLF